MTLPSWNTPTAELAQTLCVMMKMMIWRRLQWWQWSSSSEPCKRSECYTRDQNEEFLETEVAFLQACFAGWIFWWILESFCDGNGHKDADTDSGAGYQMISISKVGRRMIEEEEEVGSPTNPAGCLAGKTKTKKIMWEMLMMIIMVIIIIIMVTMKIFMTNININMMDVSPARQRPRR